MISSLKSKFQKAGIFFIISIFIAFLTMTSGCGDPGGTGDQPGGGTGGGTTAGTGTVSGTVDNGTNPLSGATVSVGTINATSDASGNYSLASVPEGVQTITATLTLYNNYSSTVTVVANVTTTHDITMTLTPPPDTTPPTDPTGVTTDFTVAGQVTLPAWGASTDAGGLAGYRIYREDAGSGTYNQIGTTVTPGYVDSTVLASTNYCYKVSAYDTATPTANESALIPLAGSCGTTLTAPPSIGHVKLDQFGTDGVAPGNCYEIPANSMVTLMFNAKNDSAVILTPTDLPQSSFNVYEDDIFISQFESILNIDDRATAVGTNYTINTVIAVDVSSSITSAGLTAIKSALTTLVTSGGLTNQKFWLYSFDVALVVNSGSFLDPTVPAELTTLQGNITSIAAGAATTDLFGSLASAFQWTDIYNAQASSVSYGFMIAITDGRDTAQQSTLATYLLARGNSWITILAVGDERDVDNIALIANPSSNIYSTDVAQLYADVGTQLTAIQTYMNTFFAGLFYLDYTSPIGDGGAVDHDIKVDLISNTNTSADKAFTDKFDTTGF